MDERLDLQAQADVEVGHRLGDEPAGGGRGGGDDRHAIADVDARLVLVLHTDARVGEHGGGGILLAQLQQEERIGEVQLHELRAAVQPFRQRDLSGYALRPDQAVRNRLGVADAELKEPGTADLEDLDFEHHLGLGQVLRGDQALGDVDRVRRVLQHKQVDLLVEEDVAGLDERPDHVRSLRDVVVHEVERLDHELLVLAQLLRGVRIDEDRALVQFLVLERIGERDEVDRLFYARVADRDARALIGAHIAVEHEGHAGRVAEDFEYRPQRDIAQLERYGLRRGPEPRHRRGRFRQTLVDAAL